MGLTPPVSDAGGLRLKNLHLSKIPRGSCRPRTTLLHAVLNPKRRNTRGVGLGPRRALAARFPGLCDTCGPQQGKSRARPSAGSGVRQGDAAGVSFCSPALVTRKSRPGAHLKSIGAFASEDLPQTLLLSRRTPRPSHQKAAPPPHGWRVRARGARLSPPRAPAPARIRPTPRRPTFHALQVPAMPREPAWTATRPGLVRKRHRCDRRARVKEQRIQRSPDVAIGSAHDARARTSLWRRRGPFPVHGPRRGRLGRALRGWFWRLADLKCRRPSLCLLRDGRFTPEGSSITLCICVRQESVRMRTCVGMRSCVRMRICVRVRTCMRVRVNPISLFGSKFCVVSCSSALSLFAGILADGRKGHY